MKKLLAVITALVLCLTGLLSAALAEETAEVPAAEVTATPAPATYTVRLSLNADTAALLAQATEEEAKQQVSAVCDLVNNLEIKVLTDGVDSELILSLAGEPVATSAFLKDDNGLRIISELFPNSILFVSQEDLGTVQGQASVDPELMASLFAEPFSKIGMEIMSRVGEPEAVEETIHDTVFTAKMPVNMTTKEIALLVLNAVKEITASEDFSKLQETLKQINVDFDPASIDQAIEDITNTSEEDMAAMDAGIFTNESGDNVTRILLTQEEQNIALLFGTVGEQTVVDANIMEQLKLGLNIDKAGAANLSLEIVPQAGMVIGITGVITPDENGVSADFKAGISGLDLLAVTFRQDNIGELTGALGVVEKTEYTVGDLQDNTSEKYGAFMSDIQVGLIRVLSKVVKAVPSVSVLMQSAMQQMMPAQTQTQTVEQPAEQPATP